MPHKVNPLVYLSHFFLKLTRYVDIFWHSNIVVFQAWFFTSRLRARPAGPKITLRFPRLLVYIFICASVLVTCAIITSRTLLPCDLTILLSTSARLLCVATILWVVYHSYEIEMDTEKQRQCRRDDARLTESGNARSEQLHICGAYRVANQQRMAAKRALEWIRTSKSRLVYRYEISDLFY